MATEKIRVHTDGRLKGAENALVALLQERFIFGSRAENRHAGNLPAAEILDLFGAAGRRLGYRPLLRGPPGNIDLILRIPPPIEKQRLYGPFVGEVFQKITDEPYCAIFGNY